jgi:hypothetical protein
MCPSGRGLFPVPQLTVAWCMRRQVDLRGYRDLMGIGSRKQRPWHRRENHSKSGGTDRQSWREIYLQLAMDL